MQSSLLEIAEMQLIFYKNNANRTQSSLLEIAEMQLIFYKDNANRTQSSSLEIAEMQLIFYKDSIFLWKHQRCAGLFVRQKSTTRFWKTSEKGTQTSAFSLTVYSYRKAECLCSFTVVELSFSKSSTFRLQKFNFHLPKVELLGRKSGTFGKHHLTYCESKRYKTASTNARTE